MSSNTWELIQYNYNELTIVDMYVECHTCLLYKAVAVEHRRLKLHEDVAKLFELCGIDDRFGGSV